jgi:predicted heme/steroid binding protein
VLPKVNSSSSSSSKETFDTAKLAKFDGKKGNKCYVAIDKDVYEIQEGLYWQNGEHTTSNGQAHCGKDLTEVIKQAPHGRSKLAELPKVGVFNP